MRRSNGRRRREANLVRGRMPHFVSDDSVYIDSGTGTSTGLLQRAMLREDAAWARLVSLYGPLVYWWCRRWGLQPSDAENVGQEVFMQVFEGLPGFRGASGGGSFRGWIMQIARNCFLNHLRKQHTVIQPQGGSDAQKRLDQIPAAAGRPEPFELREDLALLLRQALELLRSEFSDRDAEIFSQLVRFGRPPAEVAAALEVTPGVIYAVKSRVIRRLKAEFAELIDF
jgi:RNA polymerase sigma-70 factor (ECF subfamily)